MKPDRRVAPPRNSGGSLPPLKYSRHTCGGVMDAFLLEGGTQDVTKIDLVYPAGSRFEQQPMLAMLTNGMLKEGTRNYTAKQIAETMDFYGAHLQTGISKDRAEISLVCLGKNLGKLLDIFSEVALFPVFPQAEFDDYKRRLRSRLEVNLEKVEFQARVLFSQLIFGDHPYADNPSTSALDAIKTADLKKFFSERYAARSAFLVISGKNTETALRMLDEKWNGKLSSEGQNVIEADKVWNYSGGYEERKAQKGAVQTAIRIGGRVVGESHPDFVPFYLTNTILGGYFGSRLMTNIREEKGYTYGISSSFVRLGEASYFCISTQVGASFTKATLVEIHREMDRLIKETVDKDELDLVQQYVSGNLLKHFDGPFATAEKLKTLIDLGLSPSFYSDFSRQIFQVTPVDVRTVAGKYFRPELLCTAIAGQW